jgi:hypothetical protein
MKAYLLEGLIASENLLRARLKKFKSAKLVSLAAGLALVPMTDEAAAEFGPERKSAFDGYDRLSVSIAKWAEAASQDGPIVYVQASVGLQSAVMWRDKKIVLGPMHSPDAINQALRLIGVAPVPRSDEFSTIGLGRHRQTEDWIKDSVLVS